MEKELTEPAKETWRTGGAYERYVGRWSRRVAVDFLAWLDVPAGSDWGDVGCGTGALVEQILLTAEPQSVYAIDRSRGFVKEAQGKIVDSHARFAMADVTSLPWKKESFDVAVSGLVLNFVPDPVAMVNEMVRVTRPGGRLAAYVWDYSGGMEMMRYFWDVAVELNPEDAALDQAERFPLCQPEPLKMLFHHAGLTALEVRAIDIPTVFRDFDEYWTPFLGKQGAAPTYLASLDDEKRERIMRALKARLPASGDGSIRLVARAWAVRGIV